MSPPKEHARRAGILSWRALAIALAVLSALETVAGASAAIIIIGEAAKVWNLL